MSSASRGSCRRKSGSDEWQTPPHTWVSEGFHHSGPLTCMLAGLDGAAGLVFISFPSESRSLFLLSVLAFGWAGSVVRSLAGAVDPASSLLVSTLDCLWGNHSPALERHFGRMRRWLQHSRRWDGRRWEILGTDGDRQRHFKRLASAAITRASNWNLCTEQKFCVYHLLLSLCSLYSVVSHLRADTQTQLRLVCTRARGRAGCELSCAEGKRSRRPSGGWTWVTRAEREGRWECDGQQLPPWPARLPLVDESMPLVLEPLLIRGQRAALRRSLHGYRKTKRRKEKGSRVIDGDPSPNHLPAEETFRHSRLCCAHLNLLKRWAAADSIYFLPFPGENKTSF